MGLSCFSGLVASPGQGQSLVKSNQLRKAHSKQKAKKAAVQA
jgi:hypothetical protein